MSRIVAFSLTYALSRVAAVASATNASFVAAVPSAANASFGRYTEEQLAAFRAGDDETAADLLRGRGGLPVQVVRASLRATAAHGPLAALREEVEQFASDRLEGLRGEAATRTRLRAASRPHVHAASRASLLLASEAGNLGTAKMKVRWTNPKSLGHSARTRKV